MDTKSSGTSDEHQKFSKKDTELQIEELMRKGFQREDLIVNPDGKVEIGYVDEFRGLAQKLAKQKQQKEESKTDENSEYSGNFEI
jgi:hypothetical protein